MFSFSWFQSEPESFEQMATKMAKSFDAPIIKMTKFKELSSSEDIQVIDTRELKEFNVSHVKGAIYAGFDDFDLDKLKSKLNKEKKIIVYCSVGYRSGKITELLNKNGYNAFNLWGGLFHLVNNEEVLVDSTDSNTTKVHGYNKEWSKWLTRGEISY